MTKVFSAKPIPIKEVLVQVRMVKLTTTLLIQMAEVKLPWLMARPLLWDLEEPDPPCFPVKVLSRRYVIGWCWAKLKGPTRRWLILHLGNHEYVRYSAPAETVERFQQFYIV